jgi:hypothetical protein
MTKRTSRFGDWLYVLAVVFLVLLNVIPLAGEYLFTMYGWKSYFLDFHLADQNGKHHSGLMGLGTIPLADGEIFQYACETDNQDAVAAHKRHIVRGRDSGDGFEWGDRGYLWADVLDYLPARKGFADGSRIGRTIEPWQQGELSGPGAPWDVKGPCLSVLGNFPVFAVDYENAHIRMNLTYTSRANRWYHWNQGETFTTGDFGHGNMSELPCNIKGTIIHKKDGSSYEVSGWGVMEDAVGTPWNWFEWGSHNWFSSNYPNGWSVGFWLAPDDWQWGYNVSPHEVWVYDASRNQYYHGKRVEFLDFEWGHEDIHGMKFPKSYRARGITDAGIVELSAKSVTFKPILAAVKYMPLEIKMAYSKAVMEGTFTYFDGTSVALTNGMGTMEFFPRYVPNMIYITPWSLALLALLIGGRRISRNRKDPVKVRRAAWGILLSWVAIGLLTLAWA